MGNRELKFLGYGFAPLKGRIIPTVHFRSKAKFKDRIRKILHRNKGQRLDQFTSELRTYLSGWSNYFGLAAFLGWARGT
ncbi:group II intron maturase-specific domain-containing protein, partial [Acinetobacter baumannii]|nr:group II intron maturase-specific domain-containing protein [Acinetobacter baumannii]